MFANGLGSDRECEKEREYYIRVASDRIAEAQSAPSNIFLSGLGVKKDDKEPLNWYFWAAEHGNLPALRNLSAMDEGGMGLEKDVEESRKLRQEAAELDVE